MTNRPEDRREGPRVGMCRAAKIGVDDSGRFLPAQTVNMSAWGVLLEVDTVRPFEVGQRARVAIQWRNEALLRACTMLPGRVVRCEEAEPHRQRVAISLDEALTSSNPRPGAAMRAAA